MDKQVLLDFLWLCDHVPEKVAAKAWRRVNRLIAAGQVETGDDLQEINAELRQSLPSREPRESIR